MTDILEKFDVWDVKDGLLHRHARYRPKEEIRGLYKTLERRKGRLFESEYETRVIDVAVHHNWSEDKQAWWSAANVQMVVLNPRTQEPYESGWRSGSVRYDEWTNDGQRVPELDQLIRDLKEATVPHTKIIITEEPV